MKKSSPIHYLHSLKVYLYPIFICWILGFYLLYHLGYKESFLFLNGHFWLPADHFMLLLTFLGDGAVLAALCTLILIWNHPETVFLMIIALLFSGIVISICKYALFFNWDRPPKVFAGKTAIHTVGDYRLYFHSFPSGHSIAVASIFTAIVGASSSKWYSLSLAFLTILISYTRIYTGVHFLGDVLVGSLLGTVIAILSVAFLNGALHYWYTMRNRYQKDFIRICLICLSCLIIAINISDKLNLLTSK